MQNYFPVSRIELANSFQASLSLSLSLLLPQFCTPFPPIPGLMRRNPQEKPSDRKRKNALSTFPPLICVGDFPDLFSGPKQNTPRIILDRKRSDERPLALDFNPLKTSPRDSPFSHLSKYDTARHQREGRWGKRWDMCRSPSRLSPRGGGGGEMDHHSNGPDPSGETPAS